jgi:hypothetical protein
MQPALRLIQRRQPPSRRGQHPLQTALPTPSPGAPGEIGEGDRGPTSCECGPGCCGLGSSCLARTASGAQSAIPTRTPIDTTAIRKVFMSKPPRSNHGSLPAPAMHRGMRAGQNRFSRHGFSQAKAADCLPSDRGEVPALSKTYIQIQRVPRFPTESQVIENKANIFLKTFSLTIVTSSD